MKMGSDKHGSKSGRYVGGFLQLFDWNAKSRKKLFASKSDLPEQAKQGKNDEGNLPITRISLVDEEEYGAALSIKGGSDYSCASSVTDDDGYGTKVPGVVARLMGLDSLPTSYALEPYSTPFIETLPLRDAPYRGTYYDFYHDQIMQSKHVLDKMESPSRNALDTRPRKFPSKPIEKFQTEILPPKSAKTIPITHHKLLSPIKSPIFVPSQDAAHIMEAAAKMIEPGPQATPRTRISSAESSSVSFKVRELKEKLVAAQKPSKVGEPSQRSVESNAAKYLREEPMNKSWNESGNSSSFKVSSCRNDTSAAGKSKGKSISLAMQAKVNVQKREGLTPSSRSLGGPGEQDDAKSVQSLTNQPNRPGIASRKSPSQSNSVLRQNNQKQNCATYRGTTASKPSLSTSTSNKATAEVNSLVRQKNIKRDTGISRTGSRKSSLQARHSEKEVPCPGVRNVPRKKRSIDGNLHFKNQVTDGTQARKHEKPSHSAGADRQFTWTEESRRKGIDVVSFTFTAPITRSIPGSEQPRQLPEKSNNICSDEGSKMLLSSDVTKLSSSGLNVISSDALSVLLEQKLKELTYNLETSHHDFIKMGATVDSDQQNEGCAESATEKAHEKKVQQDMSGENNSAISSVETEQLRRKYIFQAVEAVDECSCSQPQIKQWNDCHLPSPTFSLEPSSLTESCYSSGSITSSSTEESKQHSSVQAPEVFGSSFMQNFHAPETETDVLDSASSMSHQMNAAKHKEYKKSIAWELEYVKDILCNVELMFKDYATGRTREIVNPHLFEQMERRRKGLQKGDDSRLERKELFNCVSECLDLKCQGLVGGGSEMWMKGVAMVKRKERLANEVYKEIQGWRSLGNSMVDELVDKDMSSKYGRWLNFEVDEFMIGVEIEGQILDSLILEIVDGIFPSDVGM